MHAVPRSLDSSWDSDSRNSVGDEIWCSQPRPNPDFICRKMFLYPLPDGSEFARTPPLHSLDSPPSLTPMAPSLAVPVSPSSFTKLPTRLRDVLMTPTLHGTPPPICVHTNPWTPPLDHFGFRCFRTPSHPLWSEFSRTCHFLRCTHILYDPPLPSVKISNPTVAHPLD